MNRMERTDSITGSNWKGGGGTRCVRMRPDGVQVTESAMTESASCGRSFGILESGASCRMLWISRLFVA